MYFLAKSFRTCSSRALSRIAYNSGAKLYKHGALNWNYLLRNLSYFITHPEQIKQQLKEKDAHLLCQFFDSDEYKSKVVEFLEMQGRILSKDTITGTKPPGTVKYQHVLSCAQPMLKKTNKIYLEEEEQEADAETSDTASVKKKRKAIKRGTIFEEIIKRKGQIEMASDSDCASLKSEKPKRIRQRSTIMPIFLKKIEERRQMEEGVYGEEEKEKVADFPSQTARRVTRPEDVEPLYARILNKTTAIKKKAQSKQPQKKYSAPKNAIKVEEPQKITPRHSNLPIQLEDPVPLKLHTVTYPKLDKVSYKPSPHKNFLETISPNFNIIVKKSVQSAPKYKNTSREEGAKLKAQSGIMSMRRASSTAKLGQKMPTTKLYPKKNMNLKSFSDFLCVEPIRSFKKINKKVQEPDDAVTVKVLPKNNKKKKPIYRLMEEVQNSRSLKSLENNLESDSTMKQVMKNSKKSGAKAQKKVITSLYAKVKLGSLKKTSSSEPNLRKPSCYLDKVCLRSKQPKEPVKQEPIREHESFTYKVVTKNRERRESRLKKKFQSRSPFPQDFEECSLRTQRTESEAQEVVSRNIRKQLNSPVAHFVEHAEKPQLIDQYHGYHKYPPSKPYLVRLPKTTPEGYRVLLYSVRDPDPTKMNFNDVVKGFCMYNDCVLSEDGLQEGYIVIFDMKDVSIGHLARVSLPALKCFLYYIQDAHPCRIKQIHVLNTATWIHHVMRLVVPLVRSELLNLVKFHKGSVPDNFPVELLPMNYGGEAPTVEELDTTTKSLLDKYRDWLIETELLKADESKRAKKSGFWSLFSGKSEQQVELDEKTILRNLQID